METFFLTSKILSLTIKPASFYNQRAIFQPAASAVRGPIRPQLSLLEPAGPVTEAPEDEEDKTETGKTSLTRPSFASYPCPGQLSLAFQESCARGGRPALSR